MQNSITFVCRLLPLQDTPRQKSADGQTSKECDTDVRFISYSILHCTVCTALYASFGESSRTVLCNNKHANMELCLRFPEGATGNACRRWRRHQS